MTLKNRMEVYQSSKHDGPLTKRRRQAFSYEAAILTDRTEAYQVNLAQLNYNRKAKFQCSLPLRMPYVAHIDVVVGFVSQSCNLLRRHLQYTDCIMQVLFNNYCAVLCAVLCV